MDSRLGCLLIGVASLMVAVVPATAQWTCWHDDMRTQLVRFDDALRVSGTVLDSAPPGREWSEGPEHEHPRRGSGEAWLLEVTWVDDVAPHGIVPGDSLVAVRWTAGPDCTLVPDTLPFRSDIDQILEGRLRPPGERIAGLPTIDLTPEHAWPITGSRYNRFTAEVFRAFLRILPTEAEWNADCRLVFPRLDRWLEEHPGWAPHPPFHLVRWLRGGCNEALERSVGARVSRPIAPAELPEWVVESHRRSCTGDEPVAVLGHFSSPARDEAALLCRTPDGWRLVVLTADAPPDATVLMRMPGEPDAWTLRAGPRDFFHWMEAAERRFDKDPVAPLGEVVILDETDAGVDDVMGRVAPTIVFFRAADGWKRATSRCCYWGQQRPARPGIPPD